MIFYNCNCELTNEGAFWACKIWPKMLKVAWLSHTAYYLQFTWEASLKILAQGLMVKEFHTTWQIQWRHTYFEEHEHIMIQFLAL